MSERADKTSQLVETVIEIAGTRTGAASALDSERCGGRGAEPAGGRRSWNGGWMPISRNCIPLQDSGADRQRVQELQAKAVAVRPLSDDVTQFDPEAADERRP